MALGGILPYIAISVILGYLGHSRNISRDISKGLPARDDHTRVATRD